MWILGFGPDWPWNNQKLPTQILFYSATLLTFSQKSLNGNFLELCYAVNYHAYNSMVQSVLSLETDVHILCQAFCLIWLCLFSVTAVPIPAFNIPPLLIENRFPLHGTFCLDWWPMLPLSLIIEILKSATALAQEPLTLLTNLSKLWVALRTVYWHCVKSWGAKIKYLVDRRMF